VRLLLLVIGMRNHLVLSLKSFMVGLLLTSVLLGLLLLLTSVLVEPILVMAAVSLPEVQAGVKLENLFLLRKSVRNSSPTGASSQIAQSGRSMIILQAQSRFPRLNHETQYSKKAAISNYSGIHRPGPTHQA
jgi:hypothetical protein